MYVYALGMDLRFLAEGMVVVKQTPKEMLSPVVIGYQNLFQPKMGPPPFACPIACPAENLKKMCEFVNHLYELQEYRKAYEIANKDILDILKAAIGQQVV